MQEFTIDLGPKEVFTLKNFSFNVQNTGSADLSVNSVHVSSNDITLLSTSVPFQIIQNSSYSPNGYLKILYQGDTTAKYHIDFNVSQTDETNVMQTDVLRYNLNYNGILESKFTEIFQTSQITYINNMLVLTIEFADSFLNQNFPNIIIKSIDDTDFNLLPKIYRLSDKILTYVFKDNFIINKIISSNITFFIIHESESLRIKNITYRSI